MAIWGVLGSSTVSITRTISTARAGRKSSTRRRAVASCSIRCRTRSTRHGCSPAGSVRSVRASTTVLDPLRPTEASCAALLQFDNGTAASLLYSGYDHFDSDEWHFGISERGSPKKIEHGAARRTLANAQNKSLARTQTFAYGAAGAGQSRISRISASPSPPAPKAICALLPMGLRFTDVMACGKSQFPRGDSMPGRREVLDDMRVAIRTGRTPVHDGRWGKATVEVALAILRSSREGREITLQHQVAVPAVF